MKNTDTRPAILVRDANETDMSAVTGIYAKHVLHGLASFEEVPPSLDEMKSRRAGVLKLGFLTSSRSWTATSSATATRRSIARDPRIATRWKIPFTSRTG